MSQQMILAVRGDPRVMIIGYTQFDVMLATAVSAAGLLSMVSVTLGSHDWQISALGAAAALVFLVVGVLAILMGIKGEPVTESA